MQVQNENAKNMSVHRVKSVNWLGMNFDLKTKGQAAITMTHH